MNTRNPHSCIRVIFVDGIPGYPESLKEAFNQQAYPGLKEGYDQSRKSTVDSFTAAGAVKQGY